MQIKKKQTLLVGENKIKNFFEIEISEIPEIDSVKLIPEESLPVFCEIINMDMEKMLLSCFETGTNKRFNLFISRYDYIQIRQSNKKIVRVRFLKKVIKREDFSKFYAMNAYRIPWHSKNQLFEWGTGIKLKQLNLKTSSLEMKEEALAA